MIIKQNYPLKNLNTFAIKASAKYYTEITSVNDILKLSKSKIFRDNKNIIFGGGSNLLLTKNLDYLVIKNNISGIHIIKETDYDITLKIGAGENWHKLVCYCVNNGFGGIENLSLIPGSVGAAPMQNIGAYGVELESCFVCLEAFHLSKLKFDSFNKSDCKIGRAHV